MSQAFATSYRRLIARPPRFELHNGVYHVVARGNERKAIYRDASDRERFLEILTLVVERYRWRVLAYCLMSNHYHLLIQTPNANLARGMRHLNGVYAQAINRRYGRDGHLFQGRYRAALVQADAHLLSAVRYIVRNPLRAGMCKRVDEWPWSSHRATIRERPAGFLASHVLLSYVHERRDVARTRYLEIVESNEDPAPPSHPVLHGDTSFIAEQLVRLEPSPEYARAHVRPPRPALAELLSAPVDSAAIGRAHQHGYSMRVIATHLGCGLTTVHRRIRAYEEERLGRAVESRVRSQRSELARCPTEHGRPDPGFPVSGTWKT